MKTPEEYLKYEHLPNVEHSEWKLWISCNDLAISAINAIKQAQIDAYNEALNDAVKNAVIEYIFKPPTSTTTLPRDIKFAHLDKQSILKLKK